MNYRSNNGGNAPKTVKCKSLGMYKALTVGKVYEVLVLTPSKNYYYIENDEGKIFPYEQWIFEKVLEDGNEV